MTASASSPVLNGKKTCIDRDFYLGHGAVVNKDYKLIRKGMKPGLDLKQDFLVDYKTDPYEKKKCQRRKRENCESFV